MRRSEANAAQIESDQMKILIFYPHNPATPQHGSHLRALQQIRELGEVASIFLASIENIFDAPWPVDLRNVRKKLGVAEIAIFERSPLGWVDKFRIYRFASKVASFIVKKRPWGWQFMDLFRKFREHRLKVWFAGLVREHDADIVVINYTCWSYLASTINADIAKVIELHDLLPINEYLLDLVRDRLMISKGIVGLRENKADVGYIERLSDLPLHVRNEMAACFDMLGGFDLFWSIADRETSLMHEIDGQLRIDTIRPKIDTPELECVAGPNALMPIGPNMFNTYSILKFFRNVEPSIDYPRDFVIEMTGRSWCDLKYQVPKNVRYLGIMENYVEKLCSSRFIIVPTAVGTGQQMKIFEALSYGIPVVCYRSAVPQFMRSQQAGILCVDDDATFAAAVSRLWRDGDFYTSLAINAKRFKDHSKSLGYKKSVERLYRSRYPDAS